MSITSGDYYLDIIDASGNTQDTSCTQTTGSSGRVLYGNYPAAPGSEMCVKIHGVSYYITLNSSGYMPSTTTINSSYYGAVTLHSSNKGGPGFTVTPMEAAYDTSASYLRSTTAAGIKARVIDKTKSSYANPPASYTSGSKTYNLISLANCFNGCSSLVNASSITIPSTVTNFAYAFSNCTALTTPPSLPSGLTNMDNSFSHCTSLTSFNQVIPAGVTNVYGTFASDSNLTGNITVANNPPNNIYATLTFVNTTKPIYIISNSGSALSTWQAIASTYSNVHYEASDASMPSIVIENSLRVSASGQTSFAATGKWAFIKFSYFKVGESNGLLPVGWTTTATFSFSKDGTTIGSSNYTFTNNGSGAHGQNTFYHNTGNTAKHTFTITITSQAKQGSTVKRTASYSMSVELPAPFAAMDFYHDSSVTDPSKGAIGVAFGTYANAVEFKVDNMSAVFGNDVYLDLDTSTIDTNLKAAITALGWNNDVYSS